MDQSILPILHVLHILQLCKQVIPTNHTSQRINVTLAARGDTTLFMITLPSPIAKLSYTGSMPLLYISELNCFASGISDRFRVQFGQGYH